MRRAASTDILHFPARVVVTAADHITSADGPRCPDELSCVSERPMIMSMPTTAHPQQRYDHRLRNLVQRTADVTRRHRPRSPSLDVPWVARQGTQDRGERGRDGPERIGTPARSPAAAATREEAH